MKKVQIDDSRVELARAVPRNTSELRQSLLETMAGVLDGSVSAEKAKHVASLAQQVHNTILTDVRLMEALPHPEQPLLTSTNLYDVE